MSHTVHEEEYKGYVIKIEYDEAPDPWEDCDGMVPLVRWDGGHNEPEYHLRIHRLRNGFHVRHVASPPTHDLTAEQITANYAAIVELVGSDVLVGALDDPDIPMVEHIRNAIDNYYHYECYNKDKLTVYSRILDWLGVPNKLETITGYHQGDWYEVLAMLTPEWVKECGVDLDKMTEEEKEKALDGAINLFSYWAFGDTWRYEIYKPTEEDDDEPEPVYTLGPYYGDYPDYGGAVSEAKRQIDNLTAE